MKEALFNHKWGFYDGSQKKFEIKKDYIETMFPDQWQKHHQVRGFILKEKGILGHANPSHI